MRTTVLVALACLSLIGVARADDVRAAIRQPTNIAAQGLAPALNLLMRDRKVQLVYRSDLVKDRQTGGATGELTFDEALTQILSGTGLTFKYLENNAVTIVRIEPPQGSSVDSDRSSATHVNAAMQGVGGASPDRPQDPDGDASDSGGPRAVLQEIVVTAEKRTQNIQVVPSSVSAIQGDQLVDLGVSRLTDYSQYVPGLAIQDGGSPGQTSVSLRGIAALGSGALVGYYIGDTPLGSSANYAVASLFALDLMPYDLERLEVLRGPQGTLYGAGAMGGLIKYVLKQANTNTFSAQVGGELSDTAGASGIGSAARAAINVPLIQDVLGIRASIYDRNYQGYTTDAFLGATNSNTGKDYGGRVALTWNPFQVLHVNISGMGNRTESDDNAVTTLGNVSTYNFNGADFYTGEPTIGARAGSHPFLQPFSKKLDYYAATINYDAPHDITVTSASSWSRTATSRLQDASAVYGQYPPLFGNPVGYSNYLLDLHLQKFTQELRAASASGGLTEWLIGGFYTRESDTNYQVVNVYDTAYQQLTGPVFDPDFFYASLPSTYKEYSAFGDLTVNITSAFDVTGGVRYGHNSQDFAQISDGLVLGGFTDQPGHSAEGVTTWSASSRYRFTRDVMLYAKVATGYRPGGPNVAIAGANPTVNSDRLTSYESGLKSTFLDGRVLLNIAGYYIDWKGIQLAVSNAACNCSYLANAGNALSRGIELEGTVLPVEGLRLGYNAAYTNGRLTSLRQGAPPFLLNFQLPGVPEWSAGATADYNWSLTTRFKASVGAGIRYVGAENVTTVSMSGTSPNSRQPAYTTADVRAGLAYDRYRINFFVRNVTNRLVYLSQAPVQNPLTGNVTSIDAVPLQPRVIGASVDIQF